MIGDTPEQLNVKLANAVDVIIVGDKAFSKQDIEALQAQINTLVIEATKVVNYPSISSYSFLEKLKDVLCKTSHECLAAHDAEVAKAAFIEGACAFDCDHALYPDQIEAQAKEYAAQIRSTPL